MLSLTVSALLPYVAVLLTPFSIDNEPLSEALFLRVLIPFIDPVGNVGIGTDDPEALLDLKSTKCSSRACTAEPLPLTFNVK